MSKSAANFQTRVFVLVRNFGFCAFETLKCKLRERERRRERMRAFVVHSVSVKSVKCRQKSKITT